MNKRTRARRAALQAVYQWQLTASPPHTITGEFNEEKRLDKLDRELFDRLIRGVVNQVEDLDALLKPHLDRALTEIDPVERAVLRLGAFELSQSLEVPWRVVVNEAVELARAFGAEQGHRYVNAVLDRLARQVRAAEMSPRG